MSAVLAESEKLIKVGFEKGKPPAQQPYFGPDSELYLTPDYLRGGDLTEPVRASSNAIRVSDGDTIVLWDGSNAGEVLKGRRGVLASTMTRLKHSDTFDREYFYYAVKRWEPFLKGQTSGSGIPHVDKEVLGNLVILNFPKPEQTKIAEVLSTVDRAIEQTEALIATQCRIKAGLMQNLLTRGIDEHGNVRCEKAHKFKDSPMGRIPAEWRITPLSELAKVDRGKFTHRPRDDVRFYGGQWPFIQTGDVTSRTGGIVDSYTQTLSDLGASVSREFPEGTIAITIAANIADTAILGVPMFFPDSVVGAVVYKPNNIRFVEMAIRGLKPTLERMAPQSAQRNINLEVLRPLLIATPSPNEQVLIAKAYGSAQQAHEQLVETGTKLRLLKVGLMQGLLTGRKRVTALLEADAKPKREKVYASR